MRLKRWSKDTTKFLAQIDMLARFEEEEKLKLEELGETVIHPFYHSAVRRDRELSEKYGVPMGVIEGLWAPWPKS